VPPSRRPRADREGGADVIELLKGVRVIESGSLLQADTVGMLLGDLGAEVIKVEHPKYGDYLRDILGQITPHHSPAHIQVNRNKRSLTLDLRQDRARDVFWKLLDTADVFVDGNLAGVCDRLGVGYEEQRRHKPDIVYVQHTGFGAIGPYGSIPTHGASQNALAGDWPMGRGDDGFMHEIPKTSEFPLKAAEGTAAGSVWAAYYAAAAVVRKVLTGEGCYVDVAASDAVVFSLWVTTVHDLNAHRITDFSTVPRMDGSEFAGAKYQFYETSDEKVVLFCGIEPKFWTAFCRAAGREDLLEQHDDSLGVDFGRDDDDLRRELQRVFSTRTLSEWMDLAVTVHTAIAPAPRDIHEVREDPHIGRRQIFFEGEHPVAGPFTFVGVPGIVDGQPFDVASPAPLHGEHTRELLGELGYDDEQIDGMLAEGIA